PAEKKRQGKFQPFKKLFGKKKKKDTSAAPEETRLKSSKSTGDVCNGNLSTDDKTNEDLRSSNNNNMGTRAFSHDSIFIPDGSMEDGQSVQATSQENIPGKVKTLQCILEPEKKSRLPGPAIDSYFFHFEQQLAKNIKFGQPPISANVKRMEDAEITPEDSDLPTIPMEIAPQEDIPESAAKGIRPAFVLVTPVKSSRPKRPYPSAGTIESINLDAVPLSVARLDNTAAKHKLSVKPKNQRVSKKHRKLTEVKSI
uniref:DUF4592 domain-containing protein n=1 Tax=Latimeria chalumnae TaxID=7897 RepID=H2ZT48_LATCH